MAGTYLPTDAALEIDLDAPKDRQLAQAEALVRQIEGAGSAQVAAQVLGARRAGGRLRVTGVVDSHEMVQRTVEVYGERIGPQMAASLVLTAGAPRGWPVWRRFTNIAFNLTAGARRRGVRRRPRPENAGPHSRDLFDTDHQGGLVLINNPAPHAPAIRYGATYNAAQWRVQTGAEARRTTGRQRRRGVRTVENPNYDPGRRTWKRPRNNAFFFVWRSFVQPGLLASKDALADRMVKAVRREAREKRLAGRLERGADGRWRRSLRRR